MNDTNPIIRDRFGNPTGRTTVSDAHQKKAAKARARALRRDRLEGRITAKELLDG